MNNNKGLKYNVKPSDKMRKVFQHVQNGETLYKAQKKERYCEEYVKHPNKITQTKSWEQLVKENLPDEKLLKEHAQNAFGDFDKSECQKKNTQYRFIELAYKVKGKLQPDQQNNTLILQDSELQSKARAFIERLTGESDSDIIEN